MSWFLVQSASEMTSESFLHKLCSWLKNYIWKKSHNGLHMYMSSYIQYASENNPSSMDSAKTLPYQEQNSPTIVKVPNYKILQIKLSGWCSVQMQEHDPT